MTEKVALLRLDFDAHINIDNLGLTEQSEVIQLFNSYSCEIAEDIQKDIRNVLHPFVNVEARISFYEGTITGVGIVWVLDWMAQIGGAVGLIEFTNLSLIPILKPRIEKVLQRGFRKIFPHKNLKTIEVRVGQSYMRPISFIGKPFGIYVPGEIVAWSRLLDDEELICIRNNHDTESHVADVLVDTNLNPPGSFMTVVADLPPESDTHPIKSKVPVNRTQDGKAFIRIQHIEPFHVLVLTNHPENYEQSNMEWVLPWMTSSGMGLPKFKIRSEHEHQNR